MRDYKKLLEAGNAAQMEKLRENEHKRGFDDVSINYAHCRLEEEAEELYIEMMHLKGKKDIRAIRHEAADIANFAHMIILKCDQEIENES